MAPLSAFPGVVAGVGGLYFAWCPLCDFTLFVKQFPTVNRVNMFRGERYNNQERPNISHGKVLATCVAILGAQPNTIRLINEMLSMPVKRD